MDRGSKGQEKKQQQKALLDRAFDRLVGSQLSALQAKESKTLTEEDEERYRATLAAEREAAEKKKRKVLSAEHAELARQGLSGQVVAMMAGGSEDSSDEAHGGSNDGRGDRKSSSKKRSKKSGRKSSRSRSSSKRSRKKKRSRSYSSDSYSSRSSYSSYSSYSSDSYSSSDDDSRRKRSKKKRHRKSKESKKRKHKHKHKSSKSDRKRDRKKSRRADDDKEKEAAAATSSGNLTAQFGKYGIIRQSDFTGNNQKVRRSFEMWLAEVKGINSFNGPKGELQSYFSEYAEDYNTATLPHAKYYDYDKWEMEEYEKKKKEAEDAAVGGGSRARSDEFKHREEMKRKEEEKRRAEVELMRATVSAKRDEMKNQALLKAELENAYKTGDQEKIRSLKRRLEPEERR